MDKNVICQWIDKQESAYIKDIMSLVAIPSIVEYLPTSDKPYGKACDQALNQVKVIADRMQLKGITTTPHYITVKEDCHHEYSVGVFSHVDVVPVGDEKSWRHHPFKPVVENGYIMGRGARDDKGPAVLTLYALKYFKDHHIDLSYNLLLYFGADEENGSSDIKHFKKNEKEPDFSFTPDAKFPVCYGEKGLLDIDVTCEFKSEILQCLESGTVKNTIPDKARAVLNISLKTVQALAEKLYFTGEIVGQDNMTVITTTGISRHAAFPEGARHAVIPLIEFLIAAELVEEACISTLKRIRCLARDIYGENLGFSAQDENSGKLTSAMGLLTIADAQCCANLNIRYPISIDADEHVNLIKRTMQLNGFNVVVNMHSFPNYADPNHSIIKLMQCAYQEVYSNQAQPYTMGGGTYARHLDNIAVAFGPHNRDEIAPDGVGGAHQINEGVSLESLKKGLEVYIRTLLLINDELKKPIDFN